MDMSSTDFCKSCDYVCESILFRTAAGDGLSEPSIRGRVYKTCVYCRIKDRSRRWEKMRQLMAEELEKPVEVMSEIEARQS